MLTYVFIKNVVSFQLNVLFGFEIREDT